MTANEFIADAIENPIGRDEEIGYKSVYFPQSSHELMKVNDLTLKKYISPDQTKIYYGLVTNQNELMGILQLEKEGNFWQIRLSQIVEKYKTQGFGSLLYDYAVMNDGLTLISDFSQTAGKLGGSRGLWEKLYRQGRFTVCGYNYDTQEIIPLTDASEISTKIYTQKEDVVWMATPKPIKESINEMLTRINKRNKYRHIEWYGTNITDSL